MAMDTVSIEDSKMAIFENESFKVLNDSNHPLKRSVPMVEDFNDTAGFMVIEESKTHQVNSFAHQKSLSEQKDSLEMAAIYSELKENVMEWSHELEKVQLQAENTRRLLLQIEEREALFKQQLNGVSHIQVDPPFNQEVQEAEEVDNLLKLRFRSPLYGIDDPQMFQFESIA